MLGGKLHQSFLREHGKTVLASSIWITVSTWATVTVACGLLTGDWPLALLFGAVATATDPAATHDVIKEQRFKGTFANQLLGIVSLDDVWGLRIFSLSLALAGLMLASDTSPALARLW